MYSCTMPVPGPEGLGGHVPPTPTPRRGREFPKNISHIICTVMVWWSLRWFRVVGLGCFNGPHEGYANRSNSQMNLPRAIDSPSDSRTVLPRAVG